MIHYAGANNRIELEISQSDLAADLAALYTLQAILQGRTRHEDALATVRQRIAATEQMMGGDGNAR